MAVATELFNLAKERVATHCENRPSKLTHNRNGKVPQLRASQGLEGKNRHNNPLAPAKPATIKGAEYFLVAAPRLKNAMEEKIAPQLAVIHTQAAMEDRLGR